MVAFVSARALDRSRYSSAHNKFRYLLLTSVAVLATGAVARADDVNITTDTNNGFVLDAFAGTTAQVLAGVTVSNTTFNFNCPSPPPPGAMSLAAICATTQAWTLTNHGTIGPANFGDAVHFTAGGTVINQGSIDNGPNGSNGIWIVGGTGGSVDNQLGGTIHGRFGAIVIGTFARPITGSVTNAGAITSDGQVIGLSGGGTVTNLATGSIIGHGQSNAVSAVLGTTTVINSGYIQSNDSGFGTGVAIAGGSVTNNAGGQILGAYNGIWANGSVATNVTNHGLIVASIAQGSGSGIEMDAGGSIVNTGTIRSFTNNAATTDSGIRFTGAGSITNSGTIESTTGGRAIVFTGAAIHTLNLGTGSVLGGNAQGGTGTDNLVLTGTGTESIAKFLGFETLAMQGSDWSLTGAGTFNTTNVTSGTLSVNGQLTSPTVTVASGGTLGGSGNVIGVVTNNGNIAPGNSIGTLSIAGTYTQATGSTYTVEVNPTPAADLINVTGNAVIQSGARVNAQAALGLYTVGNRYTILTASTGVVGTYDTLTDNAPFVDFTLAYDVNNVYLDVLRASVSFQSVAQTPNQRAAAGGTEQLGIGNPIFDAVLNLTTPEALMAFDRLSGEIHGSLRGSLIEETRFIRDAITARLGPFAGGSSLPFGPAFAALNVPAGAPAADALAYAGASPANGQAPAMLALAKASAPADFITAWATPFGNWGRTQSDGNAATLTRNSGGFIGGIDKTMRVSADDWWRFGLAGGIQRASLQADDRASSAGIDSYLLAAYAGRQQGPLGLRAGASIGWHAIETSRSIAFPGFSDAAAASYGAYTAQVFGEAGYRIQAGTVAYEPFVSLAYVDAQTRGFIESGGAAALTGTSGTTSTGLSTLGLRAWMALPWNTAMVAKAGLGWRHAFGSMTPTAELAFASAGAPFVVAGVPIAQNTATVDLGIDGTIAANTTFGIAYTGQIGQHAWQHGFNARLIRRF